VVGIAFELEDDAVDSKNKEKIIVQALGRHCV